MEKNNHLACNTILVLLGLCLSLTGCRQEQSGATPERPNIIVVMTDDHTRQATSIYDSTLIRTPNIDRIGLEGMCFDRAFVTNSICAPSRAVMLTGLYSHRNGLRDNADIFDTSQVTFPKLLRLAGYYTALVGKWHLKTPPSGFDTHMILPGQGQYYNPDMIMNGDTSRLEGYVTDLVTDLALDVIREKAGENSPFCLLIHHKAPHRNWMPDTKHLGLFRDDLPVPETFFDDYETRSGAADTSDMRVADLWYGFDLKLQPGYYPGEDGTGGMKNFDPMSSWERVYQRFTPEQKARWDAHYDSVGKAFMAARPVGKQLALWKYQRYIRDYLRCVTSVDENVGRILDELDKRGLADNTLVIYTSDQGFYLGEHGWYDKRFMYEESFSTPFLIRYPESIPPGTRTSHLALNLDIGPTILDVAGVNIPSGMQGSSLKALFRDGDAKNWRSAVYYHYYQSGGWHHVPRHRGVRTDRYKLIHFYELDAWELYDLETDPHELDNLYGREEVQDIAARLKKRLAELREAFGDTK